MKKNGKRTGDYEEVVEDPGVEDKRLLVVESEFAGPLKMMQRDGNVLSNAIRNLWERGDVGSLTRKSPARTTGAHVSIIGHIVFHELRVQLAATDVANGFANRFLFVCAQRSKVLPDGGQIPPEQLQSLSVEMRSALERARDVRGLLIFSTDAHRLWRQEYERLTTPPPGQLGMATARAAPHVLRLSNIFALADGARIIETPHLRAALAVWDYCARSAEHIFGGQLGNKLADRLLEELREAAGDGLSRQRMRERLRNNSLTAAEIKQALELLERYGLARMERLSTGGRPAEHWYAVESAPDLSSVPSVLSARDGA